MNRAVSIFKDNRKSILSTWVEKQFERQSLSEVISKDELVSECDDFLNSFLDDLSEENFDGHDKSSFVLAKDILSAISLAKTRKGFTARETGFYINSLKDVLVSSLKRELTDLQEFYEQTLKVNHLIDGFEEITFDTYLQGREAIIIRRNSDAEETLLPVLKVWEGILAVPVIGTLDSARAETITDNLLREIARIDSAVVIVDISGVPAVDSTVANHLLRTGTAIRLMGGTYIVSGIRPEIAQSITHAGIDLTGVVTKSTMANALKYAFHLRRLHVVRK
jgi:rsbT co-antagonist protein RsbR